jgi:hypothetical protein
VNYPLLFNGSLLVFGLAAVVNAGLTVAASGVTLASLVVFGAGLLVAAPAAVALYRGDDPFEADDRHWLAVLVALATLAYIVGLALRYSS